MRVVIVVLVFDWRKTRYINKVGLARAHTEATYAAAGERAQHNPIINRLRIPNKHKQPPPDPTGCLVVRDFLIGDSVSGILKLEYLR